MISCPPRAGVAPSEGESAWEAFSEGRFDLAVLDIMMPRAEGIELLRRIRARDERMPMAPGGRAIGS